MVYLLIAVFAGACKGFCGKMISGKIESVSDSIIMSVIRMIFCCIIGVIFVIAQSGSFVLDRTALGICVFSGVSMSVFLISWLIAAKSGAYMLISAFTTASFIVTTAFGFLVFKESVTIKQLMGMVMIIVAIMLLIKYNNRIKTRLTVYDYVMLVIVLIFQGLTSVSQKMYTAWVPGANKAVFNFYTFLITFVILGLSLPLFSKNGIKPNFKMKSVIIYIAVMAVMLFLNSYFMTAATEEMSSIILFPMNNVLSLAASTIMASVFFKEKLTATSAAGIVCTFIAVLLTR